ncbi:DUF2325 domain-containing protein [Brevibacillus thermoruber]|uniref:DUF2325 domain-containing protein n=1 Tax=Brevibacillus thermoruber TaxID=33942 RepID=A0A9X3TRR6_9BACL|nr:DUF2325 domain-containing protein [Brevibacillus thermoruber]MDA5109179.1 DUF2325 domain-containing protein [Brevibacillus thermoruber]
MNRVMPMPKEDLSTEHFEQWRSWYFTHVGPRELPQVCARYDLCPPGFRSVKHVPYPTLNAFFRKHLFCGGEPVLPRYHAAARLYETYPDLEKKIASLPIPCTLADVLALEARIDLGDVVLGLILSGRDDLTQLALSCMNEMRPFEPATARRALPAAGETLEKENRRLKRLLDDVKKTTARKQKKWDRETAALRDEIAALRKEAKEIDRLRMEQDARLQAQLQEERTMRQAAERHLALMERNWQRALEQNRKLQAEVAALTQRLEEQRETVCRLQEESARLHALLAPPPAPSIRLPDASPEPEALTAIGPAVSPNSDEAGGGDPGTAQAAPVPVFDAPSYPPEVRGILRIPVRASFGLLSTEDGTDVYVSEKILLAIKAEDGDELEGMLVGEYSPGFPQYRYRVLRKGAEPSHHRELLGIVDERAGWIGVRDLYDDDLFIPLHAYELEKVAPGDVVTLLFDAAHPHNNRILTVHEHLPPDESGPERLSRRKGGRTEHSQDGEAAEAEATPALQDVHVLICGAQSNMVSQYEEAKRARGGSVIVLESQPQTLQPYVAKADLVICNTHQIKHSFYWAVKEEASRQQKPVRYPLSGGVSSMLREVTMFVAESAFRSA